MEFEENVLKRTDLRIVGPTVNVSLFPKGCAGVGITLLMVKKLGTK